MSSFLCRSVSGGQQNNSMSEGGLYYAQFTQQSQTGRYLLVNAVTCKSKEDVEQGTTVYDGVPYNNMNAYGALEIDMAGTPTTATSSTTACYAFRRGQ